ncbi:hypothetical protein [Spirosoma areae]
MENPDEKSQNQQQFLDSHGKPLTGIALINAQKAAERAALAAEANLNAGPKPPIEAIKDEATATGETEEQRIAKAIAAVREANPDMSIDDIASLVTKVFKKTETVEAKVDKEAARIISFVDNTFKKKVFLKKDKDRQFPLEEEALNGVVVRQTYRKTTEEGDAVTVPARNVNEIAIYSKEDFERLNHGDPKKPGFAREGITVEVWHKPGQTDTVQD